MRREIKINLAIGILLLVALASACCLGVYYYCLRQASAEYGDLAEVFYGEKAPQAVNEGQNPAENEKETMAGFAELYNLNNDLVGWLTIPGTDIDYPVMYTPKEPEHYLYRDFEGDYSFVGSLFVDGQCALEPRSDNLIIHGHNMKNGAMFAALLRYEEREFWQSHPEIVFYFRGEKETYAVMAAFQSEVYNDALRFKCYDSIDFLGKAQFDSYIAAAKKVSLYETGVNAQYGDRLLTLSTCSYHTAHGRFIVLAQSRYLSP